MPKFFRENLQKKKKPKQQQQQPKMRSNHQLQLKTQKKVQKSHQRMSWRGLKKKRRKEKREKKSSEKNGIPSMRTQNFSELLRTYTSSPASSSLTPSLSKRLNSSKLCKLHLILRRQKTFKLKFQNFKEEYTLET